MTEEKKELTPEQKAAREEHLKKVAEAQEKQQAERDRVVKRLEEEFLPLFDGETLNGVANIMQGITEWANKLSQESRNEITVEWEKGKKLEW